MTALLFTGDLPAALRAADAARDHPYPPTQPGIALVTGIIRLRQTPPPNATEAVPESAPPRPAATDRHPGIYAALDTTALAHSGLTLTDHPDHADRATEAFHAARGITTAPGVVTQVLRLFDALAVADPTGALDHVRPAAAGDSST